MDSPRERAAYLKRESAALGFDRCGIAACPDANEAAVLRARLDAWLAQGHGADMAWLERQRDVRADITRWLPGTRSVVVVARNYRAERPAAEPGTGCVSRYAWGRDYHRVLQKPLRALAQRITLLSEGTASRVSVDSGPVQEKYWAMRAGLGWLGRHSLLITPDLGSWVFLGLVATTLELEPDAPMAPQCGDCDRCRRACPTGAIVAPGVVDARRCLSYHLVENAGMVPETIAAGAGNRVFGCDTCQEACPWNAQTPITREPDFHPRPEQANPALDALLEMDAATFRERFAGSSLMRAGWAQMQRNAAIAKRNGGTAC